MKKPKKAKRVERGTHDQISLMLSSHATLTPRVSATSFPDESFEGFSDPRMKTPGCGICEGDLRAGQILVVLDSSRIAHLSCFEGTKVHEAKSAAGEVGHSITSESPKRKA